MKKREHRVLSAILWDRKAYESIEPIINEEDFSDEISMVVEKAGVFYANDDNADKVDQGWLQDTLNREYPRYRDVFTALLAQMEKVSVPNVVQEFKELKKEAAGHALAQALVSNTGDVAPLLEKYNLYFESTKLNDDGEVYIDRDINDLLSGVRRDNLIRLYPAALNDAVGGGVVRGTQLAVYAPTEVGKSLFSINLACGFLHNGFTVLYCGNEDPASMMLLRFYSRLSGMTREKLLADPDTARKRAYANGYKNLVFYEMSPGNMHEIKKAVEKYKPAVLVVDQMANLECPASFSKVEKNEWLAMQLRALTKKEQLVTVIVHQASDSAYGKLIVEKNDMYYSNVGVQGQMDVMIGLGMNQDFEQQNKRMVCLTKNKINANHEPFPVRVDPYLSKVVDL